MASNPKGQFVVALVLALPGVLLACVALTCLVIALPALWTGLVERPDFMGPMGNVRIVLATDPDGFWSNVEFYGVLSILLGAITVALLLPLAIRIAAIFRRS